MLAKLYPGEWREFVEELERNFTISVHDRNALEALFVSGIGDDRLYRAIEAWKDDHIPTFARTFEQIASLRTRLRDQGSTIDIIQVLWPTETNASYPASVIRKAHSTKVDIVPVEPNSRQQCFADLLPRVRGEFLWSMPGGSRLQLSSVAASSERIFGQLARDLRLAMYFDGSYSAIWRTSALNTLAQVRGFIPADMRETAEELKKIGYKYVGDRAPESALCHFENVYIIKS
jgi:hypothetical protein